MRLMTLSQLWFKVSVKQARRNASLLKNNIVDSSNNRRTFVIPNSFWETWRKTKAFTTKVKHRNATLNYWKTTNKSENNIISNKIMDIICKLTCKSMLSDAFSTLLFKKFFFIIVYQKPKCYIFTIFIFCK